MSSCRTETLDVTGACCKKLRSELAAHSNLGSLSAAAPRSPGYRDPAKPLSSYDRDLDANDAKSRRISSSARAGIRRASRVVQLRNPIHGEPENGDSKAIIQAMTETRKRRLPHDNPPAHHLWSSSDAHENAIDRPYEGRAARRSSDLAESNLEKVN